MELSGSEYKAIVESSPNMIWRAGTDSNCNYFNTTWLKFTGRTQDEETGDGWTKGVHTEDLNRCVKTYLESFNKHEAFEMEYRLRRFDGQFRWINDRGVPLFDENCGFIGYIGSCMDVTEKVEGKKLINMAHNDKLTGIFNRNYLDNLLGYEFQNAIQEQTDFIIMMMDIDNFKFCNDHYGHDFGDKVLKLTAGKILASTRKKDTVGRFGGDEFVVMLPSSTIADAKIVAGRILEEVNELVVEDSQLKISLSIGIANRTNEVEVNELIKKADNAMYKAKRDGGNRLQLFEEVNKVHTNN